MPFVPASESLSDRLVVNIFGQDKRGKTSLALTFPSPKYYFNFDFRFAELLRQKPALKEGMLVASYLVPPAPKPDEAEQILDQFIEDWEEAINTPGGGTVILDTATHLWELISFVKVGQVMAKRLKLAEEKAKRQGKEFDPDTVLRQMFDFGPANLLMSAILRSVKKTPDMNAAYINRAREVFDERGSPTGQYAFHGWKGTQAAVDVSLEMTMKGFGKAAKMVGIVGTNGFAPHLEGMAFENLDYDQLVAMFLGDSGA